MEFLQILALIIGYTIMSVSTIILFISILLALISIFRSRITVFKYVAEYIKYRQLFNEWLNENLGKTIKDIKK